MQNNSGNPDSRRADETRQQYLDVVRRRIPVVADRIGVGADQVTPAHLIEDLVARSQELRPNSIRFYRSALSDWFRQQITDLARRKQYLDKLEMTRYRLQGSSESPALPKYADQISRKDWETVRSHLLTLKPGWPLSAGLLMEATLYTGLRPVEWKNARLVEFPAQWMADAGVDWSGPPSGQITCLVVSSARHTNQKGKENERLVPVLPDALASIRTVLDLLKNSVEEGKPFTIWQKEMQRGCRNLMRSVFPRRGRHYTLYSACRRGDALEEVPVPKEARQKWLGLEGNDSLSGTVQHREIMMIPGYRRPFNKPSAKLN